MEKQAERPDAEPPVDPAPTSVHLRREDLARLDAAAIREDRSRSSIIRAAIKSYLDRERDDAD